MTTNKDAMLFNTICCVGAAIYFLCIGADIHISAYSYGMAILFALVTASAQFFQLLGMSYGSMSFTILFAYLSMLIPTMFGVVYYGQPVNAMQIVGLVFMIVTLVLSVDTKGNSKASLKWIVVVSCCFFAYGFVGVCQQIHQSSEYANELIGFLLWTFIFSTILFGIIFLFTPLKIGEKRGFSVKSKETFMVLGTGVMTGILNHLGLYLSGKLPSILFFPICNGGVLVLSSIAALVIFREKLTKRQLTGVVFGIASVLLLGM